ncbi:cytochrome c oxidase subunit 3 [Mesorhizobium sp. BAC0120]|uniref:cytochrome c oxidase subunit 3 n=1 Tax=Mesorhizobium sp. BAC0120 TaxID=3090670 RepID=UPI00298C2DC8|nr:cytochrome c oxidase subunit 3 [Mesorhizobium sp. BAC0120]MDW6025808.1 cytochrome c oxidase subunit 3 [Mesorhizobium sp. BAC0120]
MSVIVVFLAVIAGISGWWLSQQRLMSKPWLEQGAVVFPGTESGSMPAAKLGLGIFLAVVGALFALAASAYFMRMGISDWRPMPVPKILWLNTGVLALSSVALQCALVAARRQQSDTLRLGLVTSGITAICFLLGQLMAWRELVDNGYLLTGNPANSFFYLLTAMHALHIVGGLVALAVTTFTAWTVEWRTGRLRLKVELCAMYWHFLLFIWIALFVLLNGWAARFVDICRQLLT